MAYVASGKFRPCDGLPGTGNDLLYTGREYDQETGLYYYRARYYDPEIGRFISEDPLGFKAGVNFYAYVQNNPVNFNDPMGLWNLQLNLSGHVAFSPLPVAYGGERTLIGIKKLPGVDSKVIVAPAIQEELSFGSYLDVGGNFKIADLSNSGGAQEGITVSYSPEAISKWLDVSVTFRKGFDPDNNGWLNRISNIDGFSIGGEWGAALPWAVDVPVDWPTNLNTLNTTNNGNVSGGFVLYPNKPNTNVMKAVYRK